MDNDDSHCLSEGPKQSGEEQKNNNGNNDGTGGGEVLPPSKSDDKCDFKPGDVPPPPGECPYQGGAIGQ